MWELGIRNPQRLPRMSFDIVWWMLWVLVIVVAIVFV